MPPEDAYTLVSRRSTAASTGPATAWSRPSSPTASASRAPRSARRCSGSRPRRVLARDGRSLVVSSLDHDQLGELYVVRAELEGLAARLAAQHAAPEEVRVLWEMVARDRALAAEPGRARPRQQALPPPDPPRQPQPLPDPAARDGPPLDGAGRHHLARRRRPRRARPRRARGDRPRHRGPRRRRRRGGRSAPTSATPSRPASSPTPTGASAEARAHRLRRRAHPVLGLVPVARAGEDLADRPPGRRRRRAASRSGSGTTQRHRAARLSRAATAAVASITACPAIIEAKKLHISQAGKLCQKPSPKPERRRPDRPEERQRQVGGDRRRERAPGTRGTRAARGRARARAAGACAWPRSAHSP